MTYTVSSGTLNPTQPNHVNVFSVLDLNEFALLYFMQVMHATWIVVAYCAIKTGKLQGCSNGDCSIPGTPNRGYVLLARQVFLFIFCVSGIQ